MTVVGFWGKLVRPVRLKACLLAFGGVWRGKLLPLAKLLIHKLGLLLVYGHEV